MKCIELRPLDGVRNCFFFHLPSLDLKASHEQAMKQAMYRLKCDILSIERETSETYTMCCYIIKYNWHNIFSCSLALDRPSSYLRQKRKKEKKTRLSQWVVGMHFSLHFSVFHFSSRHKNYKKIPENTSHSAICLQGERVTLASGLP